MNMWDILIIGGGPAGVSAALTARQRNKSCAVLCDDTSNSAIFPSRRVNNYPGLPAVSGREMLEIFAGQCRESGADWLAARATAAMDMGGTFGVAAGQEYYESRALILCTGIVRSGAIPGERELLGRGVSTCVTCDGMLYRGKEVCVLGFTAEAEREAELLRSMGCTVQLFTKKAKYAVLGTERVEALEVNGESVPCAAVFILRGASLPDALLPGLPMDGERIAVQPDMSCALPGVFAAGDCTGAPYQIARAVGQGNTAALSACAWLEAKK